MQGWRVGVEKTILDTLRVAGLGHGVGRRRRCHGPRRAFTLLLRYAGCVSTKGDKIGAGGERSDRKMSPV